jgi:signal transduction histidine kinase/ActR/RegA family two-component response regulator
LVSHAARLFAETTSDHTRLLEVIADTLTDAVCDGCLVQLATSGTWLCTSAVSLPGVARPSASPGIGSTSLLNAPLELASQPLTRRVFETGEPLVMTQVDFAALAQGTSTTFAEALRQLGVHSLLWGALRVRAESLGLLSLVRFKPSSPPFGAADVELARTLADHAALAVSNARLLRSAVQALSERERSEAELFSLQEQLRQGQKLEAVGRLAGGVAHDFNNLLSVISSYAELMSSDPVLPPPLQEPLEEIRKATGRATRLTRQLLAFSRRQVFHVEVLDLNLVVAGLWPMLPRLLGPGIEVDARLSPEPSSIAADKGQLEQVLMNLVLNARDAMPAGGRLGITTGTEQLDRGGTSPDLVVSPGTYVVLTVDDTGVGMDDAIKARLFEPFFTTKEKEKGTGLGLSTVLSIVRQSGGFVTVSSAPGKGSTFRAHFPKAAHNPSPEPPASPEMVTRTLSLARAQERVLIVENDEQVRALMRRVLSSVGYTVLDACDGPEAIQLSDASAGRIDVLVTETELPHLSGRQLAERLRRVRPELRVLYLPGAGEAAARELLEAGAQVLEKPLTPARLTAALRAVLEATTSPST